jgi:hypothetical protein
MPRLQIQPSAKESWSKKANTGRGSDYEHSSSRKNRGILKPNVESLRKKKMGEVSVQDKRCFPSPVGFLKIKTSGALKDENGIRGVVARHDQEQNRFPGSCSKTEPSS